MIDVIVIHVAVKVARVIVLNVARASYVFLKTKLHEDYLI